MIAPSSIRRYRSFTLVEMLVVLAIISILAILSLPAIKGVMGSMDLKGAASETAEQFELARQTASTRNLATELRIYLDTNTPDPNAPNPSAGAYRISAVVISTNASGAAADEFVASPVSLPGDIIYDQSATYSTLLNQSSTYYDNDSNTRLVTAESTTAPALVAGLAYMRIAFLPNGTVNLPELNAGGTSVAGNYCLSLRNLHGKATSSPQAPANNYITFVLDPGTSRARIYQPGP